VKTPLTHWKIEQFKREMTVLVAAGYTHSRIAAKMGWGKGNFSRYFNNTDLITESFLTKFYKAWDPEIKSLREKQEPARPEPLPDTLALEKVTQSYPRDEDLRNHINTLKKNNESLRKSLKELIATNQKLTDALIRLRLSPGKGVG